MSEKPKQLSQLIKEWLKRSDLKKGLEKARLAQEWESIVGPRISAVSRPIDVRGETLLLEVEDPVWRTELSLLQESILDAISRHPEIPKVSRIRFVGSRSGGRKE